ncbi:MAG TPA: hypothetical protein VE781_17435 [Kineosporiaceae bacterium]|nr:hypothetical protein [Kineosporiaceae bacterium]
MTRRLFVLERYEPSGAEIVPGRAAPPLPARCRLVAAVHLPADGVLLALVEGPDADTVASAAEDAGWRVDRLCPADWVVRTQPDQEVP